MVDAVRVDRLREFEISDDPWGVGFEWEMLTSAPEVSTCFSKTGGDWTPEQHAGRIRFFMNHPEQITPLHVDNVCSGRHILPLPVLVDGWHRFFAVIALGVETVDVEYGGRLDVLDYLVGRTSEIPGEK
jgi:hypothetical protein